MQKIKPRVPAHNQKAFVVFCKFLEENNALDEYFSRCGDVFSDEKDIFILTAFIWEYSNFGHEFWREINQEWGEICQTLDN